MRVQRTPWWYFPIAIIIGWFFGTVAVKTAEKSGVSLIGAPWTIPIALVIVGLVTFYLAWQVHQYVTANNDKRKSWFDPKRAVFALVQSKALGIAAALLAGWYLGQFVLLIAHVEAPYYRTIVIQCGVTGLVCLADMVVGIVGEWMCQLPPIDGPENPSAKRKCKKGNGLFQPATKERY
ncbi:DUF3180 domain-containing protein [Bifidobacterium bombi]|uniref:DUF3180 domain-containing protein n=1 Tax=Bifidobacterium bombi DSM 19703 TaxID=1341695 RepID=A0A080N446_9BIFI|nr:DUF3180 domain-containing protein [Bifidobacterium bombi]KFF31030.1 hypothetical protein BBOMB_0360 [Bifidobacterium bombi DSM 19703]